MVLLTMRMHGLIAHEKMPTKNVIYRARVRTRTDDGSQKAIARARARAKLPK